MALPPVVARLVGDTSDFSRKFRGAKDEIGDIERGSKKASSSIGLVGKAVGVVGGAFAAVQVGGWFKDAIMGASDLAETISKVGVVFGAQAKTVESFANQMAKDFGLPKQEMLDAAASIGLIGKASGLSQGDAAKMSTQLAKLAADASSFYNVPLPEALQAIQSGLVGEAEPMRRFGVLLNAQAVDAEAAALGLEKVNGQYTEGAKAQARASLIMKGMTDATGDLERTQGSLANRLRELQGRAKNFATSVGSAAIPVVLKMLDGVELLGKGLSPLGGLLKQAFNAAPMREATGGFHAFIAAFKAGDGDITSSGLPGFLERLGFIARQVVDAALEAWGKFGPKLTEIFGQVQAVLGSAFSAIQAIFLTYVGIISELWDRFGSHLWQHAQTSLNAIIQVISGALKIVQGVFEVFAAIFTGDWARLWDGIKMILAGAWDVIVGILKAAINAVSTIIGAGMAVVSAVWSAGWNGLVTVVRDIGGVIAGVAQSIWSGLVAGFRAALNTIIRGWNALQFRVPGFSFGPISFGGFTLGVPDVPLLARGGSITRAGLAVVGEHGPELVALPTGAQVAPLDGAHVVNLTVNVHAGMIGDKEYVARTIRDELRSLSYTTGGFRFAS